MGYFTTVSESDRFVVYIVDTGSDTKFILRGGSYIYIYIYIKSI